MQKTKIEYLTHAWNPLAMLCARTESPGCLNCWHQGFAKRHAANPLFSRNDRAAWAGKGPPELRLDELEAPSKLKKPSRIGVQFMGDLFHKKVTDKQIKQVFVITQIADQHTYMFLTKRPERMAEMFYQEDLTLDFNTDNIWCGVSVSNQADADRWLPSLLRIPEVKHYASLEPLLGSVDIKPYLRYHSHGIQGHRKLDLVITGGESGPGARPAHPDWFRKVRDDCAAADVPFFLKQLGEWMCFRPSSYGHYVAAAGESWDGWKPHHRMLTMFDKRHPCPEWLNSPYERDNLSLWGNVARVGKKAAGRHLDGVIHSGWPGK